MYSSLIDAPVNTDLIILQVKNENLEKWLRRMGLFVGDRIIRNDKDIDFYSVRVRTDERDVIVPAGLVMKIYVHLESGEKITLKEMEKNSEGHIEIHSGGKYVAETIKTLGISEDTNIRFIRSLPHMDYVALINRNERTRLSEGEAARIWGNYENEEDSQFFFAKKDQDFSVKKVIGGPKAVEHLATHGVEPGVQLFIESIDQAKSLDNHGPGKTPVIISSPEGLRLYLNPGQAGSIIIRTL